MTSQFDSKECQERVKGKISHSEQRKANPATIKPGINASSTQFKSLKAKPDAQQNSGAAKDQLHVDSKEVQASSRENDSERSGEGSDGPGSEKKKGEKGAQPKSTTISASPFSTSAISAIITSPQRFAEKALESMPKSASAAAGGGPTG